jgi:hypothetical protein
VIIPTYEKLVAWLDGNEYRPFCSRRCKLINFGDWAAEIHSIPSEIFFPKIYENQEKLQ